MKKNNKLTIYKELFWPTIIITVIISLIFVLFPDQSNNVLNKTLGFMTGPLGWLWLIFTFAVFIFAMWLSFSKVGNVKLGNENDTPDFKTGTWLGMIFTGATGSSIMYWGTIEWAFYYNGGSTPWGAAPGSWEAAEWATSYAMFHEGLSAWALYAVAAAAVGYVYFVRKKSVLRISEACRCVLGDRVDGLIGKFIDISFIFAIIAGTATSIGFGTPIISGAISKMTGIPFSFKVNAFSIMLSTIVVAITLWIGMEKGMKFLSNLNVYLLYFVLGFIFIVGPTAFILNHFSSTLGHMFQNFIRMSFWTDAVGKSSFPQWWTIFYWAWWIGYAPSMGIFLAQISKGRTIKELVLGVTLTGTIGCWLIYGVLSNYAINLDISGTIAVSDMIINGEPGAVIAEIIYALPFGSFILPLFAFTAFIYQATTTNAVAYSLASVTTKVLPNGVEPEKWNRVFWVFLLSTLATSLMYLGGLKPLQTAAVVTAFPLMIVLSILYIGLVKNLKEDGLIDSKKIISPGAVKN